MNLVLASLQPSRGETMLFQKRISTLRKLTRFGIVNKQEVDLQFIAMFCQWTVNGPLMAICQNCQICHNLTLFNINVKIFSID